MLMNSDARFNKTTGSHVGKDEAGRYFYGYEFEWLWFENFERYNLAGGREEQLQKKGILCQECYTTKLAIETKIRQ